MNIQKLNNVQYADFEGESMTDEILKYGEYLKKQIHDLDLLIWSMERQKTGIIVESKKLILRTIPFGGLSETSLECGSELADKIYKLLKDHLEELKKEYKNLC